MNREFLAGLEAHRHELIGFCRWMLWNKSDLEDAVQETILQAIRAYPRFTPGTNFRSWLFRVAAQTIFNLNRKRRPIYVEEIEAAAPSAETELALEDAYDRVLEDPDRFLSSLGEGLRSALESLGETERAALLLRSICGMRYREIANLLDIPIGTVMSHLSRGRAKLRRILAEHAYAMR